MFTSFFNNLIYNPLSLLNLWISMAISAYTHLPWLFIIPLVMSVVSMAWLGNAFMMGKNLCASLWYCLCHHWSWYSWNGGLDISRVKLIFSFKHNGQTCPCVLSHWFSKIDEEPDFNTGMWGVEPDFNFEGEPLYIIICLDMMICAAHLIGEANRSISADITHISALDKFNSYYINKYINHHVYELAF